MELSTIIVRLGMLTLAGVALWGQDQQAPPPPAPSAHPPAGPLLLTYSGKPIAAPFQCTFDDIQWAGLSCTDEDPCPIYLELSVVESLGSKIFVAGNIHAPAITLYSVLLGSEDGGQTWREVHERIRGAGLDRIQFFDGETGWASGETLSPLPQDPFMLVTSDGGKTWRLRPIFSEGRESRYGMVQQFVFSSKTSGSLTVDRGQGADGDRYELYESPDGGDSWSIRQTSNKPIQLRRAPSPGSPEWRLRSDRVSQSFHVEHRQGERWSNVAAFAVKLSSCKPPRPPEENPPVPPVKKEPR